MNIFCRHSVFISLAWFCLGFVCLWIFKNVFTLNRFNYTTQCWLCSFAIRCQAKFIVTPFSIRMKLIWTLHRIASIVCCDAAVNSIAHNNTKNVFIHRTNKHWMCTAPRRRYIRIACKYAAYGRHSHRHEHSEKSKTFDGWHLCCAHMLTIIFASLSISFVRIVPHGAVWNDAHIKTIVRGTRVPYSHWLD